MPESVPERSTQQSPEQASPQDGADLCPLYLKLNPEHIVELLFILESYEGLAVLRTLDADRGEVVVLALRDTREDVEQLLEELRPSLPFEYMTNPASAGKDWLLAECAAESPHGAD